MDPQQLKMAKIAGVFAGLLIFVFWLSPFVIIDAGFRGVVLKFGAVGGKILDEGLQFRIPIMEDVVKIDVRTQKIEQKALAYSKDIQQVDATIALNYRLNQDAVNKLYQEIGRDYKASVVDPAIQESVKAAIALFTAQELVELRPKVKEAIKVQLLERLSNRHIVVEDFSIVNFNFSESYEKAVEEKQVAQQLALKAENELKRIQVEAEQRVTQAKAEAQAIQIQAQAITQQGGRDYVQMKAIEKWDGKLPAQMIPGATVPFIDLNK